MVKLATSLIFCTFCLGCAQQHASPEITQFPPPLAKAAADPGNKLR